ncbi:hypothetical protein E0Z10_g2097 [Xylaria hypoxylon]|uniref:Uncharacterized protein n=1 Tax=Xylaria hypoxylon TaxID=37992 RepID=A0A4Z0Z4S1_9PEZI|nr:hypothetical protein E0Z10_g2097 [Xylaria hypoxylon]
MFSTTAKNLTSNIPFRWTKPQVVVFEDWIHFKEPNATTADITPLLRMLDLDGYEDIKNMRGECVHDLIIVKVRRKLARTNGTVATDMGDRNEKKVEKDEPWVKAEKEPSDHEADAFALPDLPKFVNKSKQGPLKLPSWAHPLKEYGVRDHTYEYSTEKAMLEPFQKPLSHLRKPFVLHEPDQILTFSTLAQASRPSNSHYHDAPHSDTATRGSSRSGSVSDSEFGDILASSSRPPRIAGYSTRARKFNNLEACMDKLKQALADCSLEIDRLPRDIESCALDTAAYDAKIEVEHLDNLVKAYIADWGSEINIVPYSKKGLIL